MLNSVNCHEYQCNTIEKPLGNQITNYNKSEKTMVSVK